MLDQADSLRGLVENKNKARIIAITSGKGGVGKSNFIVNIAMSLQNQGKKVLILDADVGMANIDILMGVFSKYNIVDVIRGKVSLENAIVECPLGVHLLSGSSELSKSDFSSSKERNMFKSILKKISSYDYVLIDTGAGQSNNIIFFISSADESIVILTPEPTSLNDGYSLIKTLDNLNCNTIKHVVVNRALDKKEAFKSFKKFNLATDKFLSLDTNFLGYILESNKLPMAVREQKIMFLESPSCKFSKSVDSIALKIVNKKEYDNLNEEKTFLEKFLNIFLRGNSDGQV